MYQLILYSNHQIRTEKNCGVMLKPIKTKKDYEAALAPTYNLVQKNLKPGTADSDELEELSMLVEAYEKKH